MPLPRISKVYGAINVGSFRISAMVMGISETVIVLNHGRVIATGPPASIQANPDVIRAYLGSSRAPD